LQVVNNIKFTEQDLLIQPNIIPI